MALELFYVAVGLVLLILAGDALVRGAVNFALRLGIPSLIVGLTVVAFGTSAPELLVSIKAVLENAPGIALGNVIGSNIANVLLVLGIPAIISTIHSGASDTRRSYLMMLLASALFIGLSALGPIVWWHALILLAGLAVMLVDSYICARAHRAELIDKADVTDDPLERADPGMPGWKIAMFLGLGLIGLPLGAELLVDNSVSIARQIGVSETVIGLTLVAVGTSLPELATTVMAALRKEADVALGNVIGSNMFNLLGIIGVAGLVGPLPVPPELMSFDLWVMAAAALLMMPFVLGNKNMSRLTGGVFVALYMGYLALLVL